MKTKNNSITTLSILAGILLFAFCFACGPKDKANVAFPPNILNEQQFTTLLSDFALAESAANMNVKNVPINKFDSAYAFNPLTENKIRKSQYDSTVNFYVQHPELYKKVYENVLANLTQMQTSRSAKKDSIAK